MTADVLISQLQHQKGKDNPEVNIRFYDRKERKFKDVTIEKVIGTSNTIILEGPMDG